MQIRAAEELGNLVRGTRNALGLTRENLALASGTGLRFIIDLERGKPTCQLAKALAVLEALGVQVTLSPPAIAPDTPFIVSRKRK